MLDIRTGVRKIWFMKHYTTFHIQKDKRINLGYCVHKHLDCPSLKSRQPVEIAGPIVQMIPKCNWCFERSKSKA